VSQHNTPGVPATDGEWQVKTTMEIRYISESVQSLKHDVKDLSDTMKEQVQYIGKISELAKDIDANKKAQEDLEGKLEKQQEELDNYKAEFNKMSGRFSVINTIFGFILAGIVSYFFWGAKQKVEIPKKPAAIVKKIVIEKSK
jgi:hypothetical protein